MSFRSEFVFDNNPGRPSCHAATLEEMPDGTLLCAWYAGSYETHPDVAIQMARKPPGADRWTDPVVIVDTPGLSEGNPVLHHFQGDKENGILRLFYVTMHGPKWSQCRVYEIDSPDGGQTWGEARVFHEPLGWMTKNKPIRHDGRVLLPLYDESAWTSHVAVSEDDGRTWMKTNDIDSTGGGNLQPTLLPLRGGRLLMLLRDHTDRRVVWRSISTDGGRSWLTPAEPTNLPNPHSGIDGVTLSSGALALAYNPSATGRSPLSVALSDDDGSTWAKRLDLETEPGEEFSYPAILQTRDGCIHVAYTWKRLRIRHCELDEKEIRKNAFP